MPAALTAIISADATQFAREMRMMENIALRAGKNVQSNLSGGHSSVGSGGRGGVIGEMVVLFREMGRGNFSRMPGSLTILLQRMGILKFLFKDNTTAARVLADAYGELAQKAGIAAIAATKKAAASASAAVTEKKDAATMAEAIRNDAKLRVDAAQAAVAAAKKKVEASKQAADAAKAEFEAAYKAAQAPGGLTIDSMNTMMGAKGNMKSAQNAAQEDVAAAAAADAAAQSEINKTAAAEADAQAELQRAEATMRAAEADELAARAAQQNALALNEKTIAAERAAAAEGNAAKASIGAGGVIAGIFVGLVAGAYAAYKLTEKLTDKLTGIKLPDLEPTYIPKHLQKAHAVEEEWKKIGKEILKTVDAYNSAAHAAERVAKVTKTHFEHQKELLEIQKQTALARAKTPAEKEAVEDEFAAKKTELKKQEHQQELTNKYTEKANLIFEGNKAAREAEEIGKNVSSKQSDEDVVRQNKAKFDAANKAVNEIDEAKNSNGFFGITADKTLRAYNSATDSGVSNKDLDAAEAQIRKDRETYRKAYQNSVEREANNDELRKKKDELTDKAGKSFGRAVEIGDEKKGEIHEMQSANKQSEKDDAEIESANKEKAKAEREKGKKGGGNAFTITEHQRLGAYIGGPQTALLSEMKIHTHVSKTIASHAAKAVAHLARIEHKSGRGVHH